MFARLLWLLVWTALGVAHAHTDHKAITTSSNSEHGVSKQQKPAIATQRWHAGSPRVLAARDGTKVQSTGASVLEEKRTFRSDSGVARPGTKAVIADHHSESASIKLESFYERRYEKTKMARFLSYKNGESTIAQADLETTGVGHFRPPSKRAVNHPKDRGLNHRHKRSTTDLQNGTSPREGQINHTVSPSTPQPRTAGDMWELLPRPLAQNQSTAFPFDYTRNYDMFTFPDADYEEITPLVPINTREKTAVVKNPFYPVTGETYGAYTIMCLSVIIFTVGIIGNIAIMCIVCHNYYMRSISNSLLANLALWDFVVLFFCLPLVVFHELTKNWLLGEFSCKIIPYIEVVSLGVTTFTLCALCIDRFRAATNVQMYYEMIENCASTSAKLAVIWVGALLLALPELLLRQLVREEREPPEVTPCERCVIRISTSLPDTLYVLGLTYDGARLWWYFGCYFCLPTLFTIVSSLATARRIRRAERVSVRANRKQIRLESQMNCTVVALAILYGFCTIPENICNIVEVYMAAGVGRRVLDILHLVSQILLFCKSALTPVLLLALCRPFGRAFLDCCCCCCEECGPGRSSSADAGSADTEREGPAELELSPFSTARREPSTSYAAVGTHC